jgi:2-methylisocitrate lyase-like PEP mutase family enzyme
MKKLAAVVGTAAIALSGVGVAQAKHGADDAHPHKHHRHHGVHHARHGADDGANHARHGADDGPNHT